MNALSDTNSGVVEVIHGIPVSDPFRWLEDRNARKTELWLESQANTFEQYFRDIGSLDSLRSAVTRLLDVETVDSLGSVGSRYFLRRRRIRELQPSICVIDRNNGVERVLVDPSLDGPYASVNIYRVSPSGSLLAYDVKRGGTHSKAIQFVDVNTGETLQDRLSKGRARGLAFRSDELGYFYCHESDEPEAPGVNEHGVYFHEFGTSNDQDVKVLSLPAEGFCKAVLRSGGRFLGVTFGHQKNGASVVDFHVARQANPTAWNCVCKSVPAPFGPFFYRESLLAYRFQGAPNGEIVQLDLETGLVSLIVVPEWEAQIRNCTIVSDRFYVTYLIGCETVVRVWSREGKFLGTLPLKEGYTWRLLPTYSDEAKELFLQSESFTSLPTLFKHVPETGKQTAWSSVASPELKSSPFVRKLSYFASDGVDIGISLVGPSDERTLKDRPVIMTAYGGFGVTMTPQFSTFVALMLELGFLFALPAIRGGGEGGKSWHEAARGRNRQRAVDDYIEAAEWLCREGYTNPHKLALFGGSNSGLLVGAAITQRPTLFRAALCMAPLLDMVRYHLFDRASGWSGEYGTAADPNDFRALLSYSPYHNVHEDIDYPSTMFVSGDQDERCNPAHARKMAARLISRSSQRNCILIDHSRERGHAANLPLHIRVAGLTNRIAFVCHELGVALPKGVSHDCPSC